MVRLTIQVSLRPLFTSHLVICPEAWITRRVQNPSSSWKTGDEYRRVLSQPPNVMVSTTLPAHSDQLVVFFDARCSKVLSTQLVLPASTANRPSAHISSAGITTHCDSLNAVPIALAVCVDDAVTARTVEYMK